MAGPALHLKPWTDQRRVLASEDPGRPARTLAGSHIADLVHLRKAVILCPMCVRKFDGRSVGYITNPDVPFCGARCDGCKEMGMERRLFLHHEHMPK